MRSVSKGAAVLVLAACLMCPLAGCSEKAGEPSSEPQSSLAGSGQAEDGAGARQPRATQQPTAPAQDKTPDASPENGGMISENEAKELALADAGIDGGEAQFTYVKLDREDGRQVYELKFRTDTERLEYEIDAITGQVVNYEREVPPSFEGTDEGQVAPDDAKAIALGRVEGAGLSDIREFETEIDGIRKVYKGEIVYDGVEYEFEIDAGTGELLEWEQEPARD